MAPSGLLDGLLTSLFNGPLTGPSKAGPSKAGPRRAGPRTGLPTALPTALLMALLTALLTCLLTIASPAAAMVDTRVDRAYGYLLGDIVTAEASIPIPAGMTLDPDSLPLPGRVNGWLHLLSVDTRRDGDQIALARRFLVTASADTVSLIWLPRVALRFHADGGRNPSAAAADHRDSIDTVAVAISPITAESAFTRNGLGELRPDRSPARPDLARIDRWLQWALAALLLAGSIAFLLRLRERRQGGGAPFRAAARELGRLARGDEPRAEDLARGYRTLHRAFDRFAGRTLLSADIADFVNTHSAMSGRCAAIRDFYARSDAHFFATAVSGTDDAGERMGEMTDGKMGEETGGKAGGKADGKTDANRGAEIGLKRDELKALRELAKQLASDAG